MTREDEFLAAVIENPLDDGPRLIYADWLDERGDPRGEFIRVQCRVGLDPYHLSCTSDKCLTCLPFRLRERELFMQSPESHEWFGPAIKATMLGSEWLPHLRWFRRGFLEIVRVSWDAWEEYGSAIVRAAPITLVEIQGWSPQEYGDFGARCYGWSRNTRLVAMPGEQFDIPTTVWAYVVEQPECEVHGTWAGFRTKRAALDALSAGCIQWAKNQNKTVPCGGCGQTLERMRCVGCLHNFAPETGVGQAIREANHPRIRGTRL